MKRTVTLVLVLLCSIFLFSSCAGELPTSRGPVELGENDLKAIASVLRGECEDVGAYTVECYGKWDGVYVFRYYEGGAEGEGMKIHENVGGYSFFLPSDRQLYVAADGELYAFLDAYKNEMIGLPQVSAVYALLYPFEVVTEPPIDLLNTPPQSTGPVELSEDELVTIAKTIMASDESASKRMAYYRIECYAKADGVYVGFLDEPGLMYAQVLTSCTVGGFTFDYSSSRQMKVCDGRGVYSMTAAYESGILTDSLLEAAYKAYTKSKQ